MSIPKITEKEAKVNCLKIVDPRLKQRYLEFPGCTDEEIICYVMCYCVKWSFRKLSKILPISDHTIQERTAKARRKLRQNPPFFKDLR